ncbi:MAG: glycosyltransferase family 9 protein [candidate division Zixibacteria bacterium]|nr:glycosyltransferase family 9 protein [candidate division Zixibacteria bacterium]
MQKKIDLKPNDHILISRTDRLGDLILALPFVETIKARYPECRVDVLSSLYASPILENNPSIDRIVRVQNDQLMIDKLYKKDLLHRIRLGEYRVVVALYPERRISQLFYKAGISARIGTAGRFHSVFFNQHLFHSRRTNKRHEYEYNLDFLEFFRDGKIARTPHVFLKEKELSNAQRILRKVGVDGSFVVLHPGSGGSAEGWSPERFLRLYRQLRERGVEVAISGSEREGGQIRKMAHQMNLDLRDISGETDLRTLAAVLSLAEVVVANSTGPLHLATAVGTRVVGLYSGRKVMSPQRWGPVGNQHRVIQPPNPDCQCPPRRCRCMETISIERVADEVISSLESYGT